MNTMLFYNPKTKESIRVKACQSKAGMWFAGRPSPAKIKSWAAREGLIHVTSRTKLAEVIGAVA
jgi:hypothetical protein